MDGINVCAISGNLVRDPDVRATASGMQVVSFTVAVNESRKNGDSYEDYANFIGVVGFGQRYETMANKGMLAKGQKVMVTGRLRYSTWEKDGQTRSKIEVIASNIDLAGKRQQTEQPVEETIYEEDIPF